MHSETFINFIEIENFANTHSIYECNTTRRIIPKLNILGIILVTPHILDDFVPSRSNIPNFLVLILSIELNLSMHWITVMRTDHCTLKNSFLSFHTNLLLSKVGIWANSLHYPIKDGMIIIQVMLQQNGLSKFHKTSFEIFD